MNMNLRRQVLSLTKAQAEENARANDPIVKRATFRAQQVSAQRSSQPITHRPACDWQVKR